MREPRKKFLRHPKHPLDMAWAREATDRLNALSNIKVEGGRAIVTQSNTLIVPPSASGGAGLNPRGPWVEGDVYNKNDMIHVLENDTVTLDSTIAPVPVEIRLRFYSTWYWPHDADTATEPNANPHAPSIFADQFSDPSIVLPDNTGWSFALEGITGEPEVPTSQIISEGSSEDALTANQIRPPVGARSWVLICACTLPLNWGSTMTLQYRDENDITQRLSFWNGQFLGRNIV